MEKTITAPDPNGRDEMSGKIDALDLVIDVMREHEKVLDELIARLEAITPTLEKAMNL